MYQITWETHEAQPPSNPSRMVTEDFHREKEYNQKLSWLRSNGIKFTCAFDIETSGLDS